ncbi:hypothetical protein HAX54_045225 [Datura stramonium]|uniref:Uncharacterized protein n=1 Tax=Datura stramonium TaxID=4076 RepID=A0ABS8RH59_DATST|nr:hypothetical protein [Datura stramonium]
MLQPSGTTRQGDTQVKARYTTHNGTVKIGAFDFRTVFLDFTNEDDFKNVWFRRSIEIKGLKIKKRFNEDIGTKLNEEEESINQCIQAESFEKLDGKQEEVTQKQQHNRVTNDHSEECTMLQPHRTDKSDSQKARNMEKSLSKDANIRTQT